FPALIRVTDDNIDGLNILTNALGQPDATDSQSASSVPIKFPLRSLMVFRLLATPLKLWEIGLSYSDVADRDWHVVMI
ncbi:MAG: hypothetical protein NTY51_06060, partial [Deltaproteobacteria bacterium]|nr:hypothetical protein [Deltaproteobacteria bacterium]